MGLNRINIAFTILFAIAFLVYIIYAYAPMFGCDGEVVQGAFRFVCLERDPNG